MSANKKEVFDIQSNEIIDKREFSNDIEQDISSEESQEQEESTKTGFFGKYAGILTAGSAFLSDGYQQGVVTMANVVLAKSFGSAYNTKYKTMVSNSLLVANIIGQIAFGFITDRVGRKQAFVFTTIFIIVGAIVCACAKGSTDDKLFWMLIIGRGILGFGVGGEYPCSATSSIESANEKLTPKERTTPFIMSTNFFVAMGVPLSTSIFLIVEAICKDDHLNAIWRTCFAIGAVIPLSIFYFRWRLDHANSYKDNAIKLKVPYVLVMKKYWKPFVSTAGMWFFMDFILYPNNIFSASILKVAIPHASLRRTGEWQLFLGSFGVFGTIFTAFVASKFLNRRQLTISGFIAYGVISFVIGGAFEQFTKIPALLIVFYAILNFLLNFGPASTQSIVSSESFPTAIRGTLYGISAAIGKAGAAIGTQVFTPIQVHAGKRYTFFLSGGVSFLGALIVWWGCPDYSNRDLSFLDDEFNDYLKEQGWKGNVGEESHKHQLK